MTDIIKEFNMIDLLGILLPGAVVTALLGIEFSFWDWLAGVLGLESLGAGIISAVLIIVGFVIGTLLHELGDVLEDLLWSTNLLNPKLYAAIASNYAEGKLEGAHSDTPGTFRLLYWQMQIWLAERRSRVPVRRNHTNLRQWWNDFYAGFLNGLQALWKGLVEQRGYTFRSALVVYGVLGSTLCVLFGRGWILALFLTAVLGWLNREQRIYNNVVCARLSTDVETADRVLTGLLESDSFLSYDTMADWTDNSAHLDAVMRKRDLFEGFKAMSRNLLLTVLGLGIYGAYTQNVLGKLRHTLLGSPAGKAVGLLALTMFAVRYYHYSYLKYKYSYEDLLRWEQDQKKPAETPDKDEPVNVAVTVRMDETQSV